MAWIYDTYSMTHGQSVPGRSHGANPYFLAARSAGMRLRREAAVYVIRRGCEVDRY